jgi:hypothetical protein
MMCHLRKMETRFMVAPPARSFPFSDSPLHSHMKKKLNRDKKDDNLGLRDRSLRLLACR